MIVDTSAILAILREEPEAEAFSAALLEAPHVAMSAATLLEVTMVTEGRAAPGIRSRLERLLAQSGIDIIPFTAQDATSAAEGWRRFGKVRHPVGLNLGDCFAYAVAQSRNEPLLFKGADFSQTDVKAAL